MWSAPKTSTFCLLQQLFQTTRRGLQIVARHQQRLLLGQLRCLASSCVGIAPPFYLLHLKLRNKDAHFLSLFSLYYRAQTFICCHWLTNRLSWTRTADQTCNYKSFVVSHVISRNQVSNFITNKNVINNTVYCIVLYFGRVRAANAPGCTVAESLLYKPWSLVVPTCTARCLHQRP